MNQQQCNEKKIAIENCVRSFIIKSIHAIVQARNGIVYNTNCISAVGARNNLMVNVEEDPEIGATIKQALDFGFPVHFQDTISLEILTAWPNGERMVVEVWQFHLDTADKLDRMACIGEEPSLNQDHADPPPTTPEEMAVEDIRQSKLFEKLGHLLKAVVITTRLLPAYQLSRDQDPSCYQMCYTLRRGSSNLKRLGQNVKYQQIGRLLSGLAVKPTKSNEAALPPGSPELLDQIYLNCTVHFRPRPPTSPPMVQRAPAAAWSRAPVPGPPMGGRTIQRYNETGTADVEVDENNRHFSRVRPAFAENQCDAVQDEQENPLLSDPRYHGLHPHNMFHKGWPDECSDEDDEDQLADDALYDSDPDNHHLYVKHGHLDSPTEDEVRLDGQQQTTAPLQLPFSTVGVSGDRLTNLFVELRENANLDLFQVPPSTLGSAGTAQSSVFDADALSDELERHEKILKEFDDFLAVFCPVDPFLSEVRPMVAVRPIQYSDDA